MAAKIAVAPSLRASFASPSSVPVSIPAACIMARLPSATLRPSMIPITPLPETLSKAPTLARARLRSVAARTIADARGCSLKRSRLAASRRSSSSPTPTAFNATTRGLPSVSVPVLSTTTCRLLQALERFRIFDQNARLRAAPDADHDRHRRRQTERARAGDDQHRHRRDQAIGHAWFWTPDRPGGEGGDGCGDDERHEPTGDLVRESLDRRAAALRLRDHLHDLRQHGVAANSFGAHHEGAALVHRAADDPVADRLADRHRLSGQHRFIDRASPLNDLAIDRDLLTRAHPQPIADVRSRRARPPRPPVRVDEPRGLWREIEQRADRAARLLAARSIRAPVRAGRAS